MTGLDTPMAGGNGSEPANHRPISDFLMAQTINIAWIAAALFFALLAGSLAIKLQGIDPLSAYGAMAERAFGGWRPIANTLKAATPLLLTGLGTAVVFRAGFINVGQEGQLYIGALCAAIVASADLGLAGPLQIILALAAAMAAGALWAAWPVFLKVRFNANEIVTTLMSSYVAILTLSYLVNGPLKPAGVAVGSTAPILSSARLPNIGGTPINSGIVIAIVAAAIFAVVFNRTPIGFEWQVLGRNSDTARYAGLRLGRLWLIAALASGAICALAGAIEVMAVQLRFIEGLSPGLGYIGILVALIARFSPAGIILIAILFGAINAGAIGLEMTSGVPAQISNVIQGLMILFVAAQIGLRSMLGSTSDPGKH
jgi:general nucleoside transport system permease protein